MLSQAAQDEERLEFQRSFAELQPMGSSSIWSATEVRFERSRFGTGVRSRSVERLAAAAIRDDVPACSPSGRGRKGTHHGNGEVYKTDHNAQLKSDILIALCRTPAKDERSPGG
jgi:hypothetical protein